MSARRWRRIPRVRGGIDEQVHDDVASEIAYHLERVTEELMAQGMDEQSARAAAERRFGDVTDAAHALEAESRRTEGHARRAEWLTELRQDVRYALRALLRDPGFALAAVLTLALGIGANTGMFAVAHGVLFRALPWPDADRLVLAWEDNTQEANPRYPFSPANYRDLRERARTVDALAAFSAFGGGPVLNDGGEPERVKDASVLGGFFEVVGARAALGRTLLASDESPDAPVVIVLTDSFWRRRYGADPGVIGREVTLGGGPATIVGVMPPDFRVPGVEDIEIIDPLQLDPGMWARREIHFMTLIGRLAPGATVAQAHDELNAIAADLERDHPESNRGTGVTLASVREAIAGDVRTTLLVLLGAVALVLLAACANIANLLLARASGRSRELGIRAALGAGRGRIARQLLTESLVLATLGAAGGVAVAALLVYAVRGLAADTLPRVEDISLNATVLLFALGVTLLTALFIGLLPALGAARSRLAGLQGGARGASAGRERHRARRVLVVAQVAFSVVLLAGAGLLVRSYRTMMGVDAGFERESVLTFSVAKVGADAGEIVRFYDELRARILALPGVRAAGATNSLPMTGSGGTSWLTIEGHAWDTPTPPEIGWRPVTLGYFDAMGIGLAQGRGFGATDRDSDALPVMINRHAADRFFPGRDAVGARIRLGPNPEAPWRTIIGVVENTRNQGLTEDVFPEAYPLMTERTASGIMMLAVRTGVEPMSLLPSIRAHVTALDPRVPVEEVRTAGQIVAASVARPRFTVMLLGGFALLGVVLAVIGTYGLLAYLVAQRQREIGIRMALGADRRRVLRMVVGEGFGLAAIGVVAGVGAALVLTRLMRSMLFEVSATDPLAFGGAALLLVLVTLAACWVPARKAAEVEVAEAVRME